MEARYEERLRGCKTQDEMAEYLLSCMPIIKEYTTTETAEAPTETKRVANMTITSRKGVARNDIYKKYLHEVENETDVTRNEYFMKPCKGCGNFYTKFLDEALSEEICRECGMTDFILGDEVGFKDEQEHEKNIVYSYKRENHFNEWISQFQAKESTNVPEEVLAKLRTEFKKQKIKDLSEITHEKVKALLKKLNYAKYYEHVPYIATILSGITPPTMPQELEDKLRLMFHAIQAPFEKHKPENRKNFLSYSFVLYKLCELLGHDEYLPCFPLLKSKEKLYVQDQIWFKICDELRWQAIKTV
jgi:predicted nucleic-acid-binding Zn-ribbon protein